MKQLLHFTERENTGKTKIVGVNSNHSGDFLGTIHWRSGWRCYVMSYEHNIDMSLSCNKELDNFMEQLEKERQDKLTDASKK